MNSISLQYSCFDLVLKHEFKISDYSRTSTPIVFVALHLNGIIGYGEASMPPYLGESHETALKFLKKINLPSLSGPSELNSYLNSVDTGNYAIKAAIDIAYHDALAKSLEIPLYQYFNSPSSVSPPSSFTLGIASQKELRQKIQDAEPFQRIKIKLGSDDDRALVSFIRSLTEKEILVDANRAYHDREAALRLIDFLATQNCLLVEQPMPVNRLEDSLWLYDRSPLPIFADESCKTSDDFENIKDCFHGINIKLMKSTGLFGGQQLIKAARQHQKKIMIGCMSESSCGILAAASIASQCDFADLDSPWMVTNNPFENPQLVDGSIHVSMSPGLGLKWRVPSLFAD